MDGRLLGLSIVIVAFAVVETSAQTTFHTTRYGKRDVQVTDGRWPKASYDRRADNSGPLFFGSRYGKRSYNMTPTETLTESSAAPVGDRYGRSPDDIADRPFFGSRYGKRSHTSAGVSTEPDYLRWEDYLVCRYTGFRHLYHCLTESEDDKDAEKVL